MDADYYTTSFQPDGCPFTTLIFKVALVEHGEELLAQIRCAIVMPRDQNIAFAGLLEAVNARRQFCGLWVPDAVSGKESAAGLYAEITCYARTGDESLILQLAKVAETTAMAQGARGFADDFITHFIVGIRDGAGIAKAAEHASDRSGVKVKRKKVKKVANEEEALPAEPAVAAPVPGASPDSIMSATQLKASVRATYARMAELERTGAEMGRLRKELEAAMTAFEREKDMVKASRHATIAAAMLEESIGARERLQAAADAPPKAPPVTVPAIAAEPQLPPSVVLDRIKAVYGAIKRNEDGGRPMVEARKVLEAAVRAFNDEKDLRKAYALAEAAMELTAPQQPSVPLAPPMIPTFVSPPEPIDAEEVDQLPPRPVLSVAGAAAPEPAAPTSEASPQQPAPAVAAVQLQPLHHLAVPTLRGREDYIPLGELLDRLSTIGGRLRKDHGGAAAPAH